MFWDICIHSFFLYSIGGNLFTSQGYILRRHNLWDYNGCAVVVVVKHFLYVEWPKKTLVCTFSTHKWNILLCCRLRKYWLKGEKAGTSEVIAILPGYPDNIRANERNEFWVAIHCRRTIYSYINAIYPQLRDFMLKLPISAKLQYLIHIGGRLTAVVVKYSPEGKLLQILEDRQGKVVRAVSEVEERDGKLWMGSVLMSFISVYQLEWTLEL